MFLHLLLSFFIFQIFTFAIFYFCAYFEYCAPTISLTWRTILSYCCIHQLLQISLHIFLERWPSKIFCKHIDCIFAPFCPHCFDHCFFFQFTKEKHTRLYMPGSTSCRPVINTINSTTVVHLQHHGVILLEAPYFPTPTSHTACPVHNLPQPLVLLL